MGNDNYGSYCMFTRRDGRVVWMFVSERGVCYRSRND
jgi:hypothetical protein